MITPQELLALSHRLGASAGEPEGRAAVSRAYYAAFHVARALVEDGCGVVLPDSPEIHRKLQFCLEQSASERLIEISDQLNSLRSERNRADYNLSDSRFASRIAVQLQIRKAEGIVADLNAAAAKLPAFRSVIRAYAKNVLRLGVRGD